MTDEKKTSEEGETNHTAENLQSVGQIIIGGIEQIGGILTGDPTTRAEGEFNAEVGSLHQETNKKLTAIDEVDEAETGRLNQTNPTETKD